MMISDYGFLFSKMNDSTDMEMDSKKDFIFLNKAFKKPDHLKTASFNSSICCFDTLEKITVCSGERLWDGIKSHRIFSSDFYAY